MTTERPVAAAADRLWTAVVIAVLATAFALTQPPIDRELAHDGKYYLLMAGQLQEGAVPHTINPFVLRVGTPWLAAAVSGVAGTTLTTAFFAVNLLAGAVAAWLFSVWVRPHVPDLMTRIALVVLFLVSPYSPFRFTFYYPTLTDSVAMLFLVMGLLVLDRLSGRGDGAGAMLMALIVAAGCVFRELVIVAAIAALFVRPSPRNVSGWLVRAIPLTGALTVVLIRAWVVAEPSPYRPATEVMRWLEWKTASMMVLAIFFVFGPLVVLLAQRWKTTWRTAVARPDLAVFAGVFAVAGWLGASDTERILIFAAPVVLMLIGKTLADVRLAGGYQFGALVALQIVTCRGLWPIGGPILPLFSEHFSYFSVWLDAWWRMFFLAIYVVTAALIVAMVRSAPARRAI